jgi:hypothetical protein
MSCLAIPISDNSRSDKAFSAGPFHENAASDAGLKGRSIKT